MVRMRARRPRDLTAVAWLSAIVSAVLFVSANGLSTITDVGSAVNAAGIVTGLMGTDLTLVMLLLAARLPIIDRTFGHDTALAAHRGLGQPAFFLLVAHGLFLSFGIKGGGPVGAVIQSMSALDLSLAYLSIVLFVLVVVSSLVAVTRRLPYEVWHGIHLVTYLATVIALPHQFVAGGLLANGTPQQLYWVALYVLSLTSITWFRIVVPIARSLAHRMRVSAVEQIGEDVTSIHLTGRDLDRLGAAGGQFAVWRFWSATTWWHAHPISFSSATTATSARITFRTVGRGTSELSRVPVGTMVWFEGPYGRFTQAARTTRTLSIAVAGIGVTPVLALLQDRPPQPGEATVLVRAGSTSEQFLHSELESAAGSVTAMIGPRPVGVSTWMSADALERGDRIDTIFPDFVDSDLYVCGPPAWADLVVRDALAAGMPLHQIHLERFASARAPASRSTGSSARTT